LHLSKIFTVATLIAMTSAGSAFAAGANDLPKGAVATPQTVGDLGMAIMSAVVNADGTLARNAGATSATAFGSGQYEVIFERDVTACTYVATIGLSATSGSSSPGFVTVVGRAGAPNGIFVTTDDATGASLNLGFHVIVFCNQ